MRNAPIRLLQRYLKACVILSILCATWGYSSVGRAFGWHPKGQGFESPYLHHTRLFKKKFILRVKGFKSPNPFGLKGTTFDHRVSAPIFVSFSYRF